MKNKVYLALAGLLLNISALASDPELILSGPLLAKQNAGLYIVQMVELPAIAYEGGVSGYKATKPGKGNKLNPNSAHVKKYNAMLSSTHDAALASVGATQSKIYDYQYSFNGFAARLTPSQVEALKGRSDIVQVWENEYRQLTTNTSPDFMGLTAGGEPWSKGYTGEDVIIGVIDTGIWPEHPSVADIPTPKKGNKGPEIVYGAPPAHWQGTACDFGNAGFNPGDAAFDCNNKLLGARYYNAGFPDSVLCGAGLNCGWTEFLSARDNDGHGSHTATTAGGNNGVDAAIGGSGLGSVSGMAPRARLAIYKVCWNGSLPTTPSRGCASIDSMAAIDQAVADGVDVINFSIGGSSNNFNGPDDIAFLFAAGSGVWVATSAGNSGPDSQTIGTPSGVPWITAVAAAQDDQVFGVGVDIATAAAGVSGTYEAVEAAISVPLATTGVVSGDLVVADPLNGCAPLSNSIGGEVALVQRGGCAFSDKFLNAQAAGASALVVFNNNGDPIVMGGSAFGILIPGVMVGQSDGELIHATLTGGADVVVTLDPAISIPKANTIATFSSRGPNGGAPDIIKPDVAAPGVAILAAETPDGNDFQVQGELFQSISGTSMASPHTAGLFALLKQAHPDWSPAMARSAIMTTARQNINKTFGSAPADPFDIGAGHVVPGDAFDPGLAYDADIFDYVRFTCGSETQPQIFSAGTCAFFGSIDSSDLNLPSIGIGELVGSQTITRTVTSVSNNNGKKSYTVSVDAPPGTEVSVSPASFKLKPGQSATYQVTISTTSDATLNAWTFGSLTWSHGGEYSVRSPIAVRPVALAAPSMVAVTDAPVSGSTSYDVRVGFSGNFAATGGGLEAAEVQPDTVGIGGATLHFVFVPPGTELARFSLFDETVGDGSGSDDLDMQVQGPDSAGFPFVAFSGSPTSEEQIDLVNPVPGFYAIFVIHFDSVAPVTGYELNFWDVGPNLGNMTVTAPGTVSLGTTESISVGWSGLTPDTRYRGIVTHSNDSGEISTTVISVDTD